MIFKFEVYFRVIAEKQDGQVSAQQVEKEDEGSETSSLWGEGIEREGWFYDDSTDYTMKLLQNLFMDHILMAWVCDHVILTPGKYHQL